MAAAVAVAIEGAVAEVVVVVTVGAVVGTIRGPLPRLSVGVISPYLSVCSINDQLIRAERPFL